MQHARPPKAPAWKENKWDAEIPHASYQTVACKKVSRASFSLYHFSWDAFLLRVQFGPMAIAAWVGARPYKCRDAFEEGNHNADEVTHVAVEFIFIEQWKQNATGSWAFKFTFPSVRNCIQTPRVLSALCDLRIVRHHLLGIEAEFKKLILSKLACVF